MSLYKKPTRVLLVIFPALFAALCFCMCDSANCAGLSDVVGGLNIGGVPVGSAVKAGEALGKSFQDITPEQEYYIGRAVA
ncbi:MAG: peptidase M48, partial [Syntrophobacteraceae bacterium]